MTTGKTIALTRRTFVGKVVSLLLNMLLEISKTETEAETSILWPPDVKRQFIGKDPDVGKD